MAEPDVICAPPQQLCSKAEDRNRMHTDPSSEEAMDICCTKRWKCHNKAIPTQELADCDPSADGAEDNIKDEGDDTAGAANHVLTSDILDTEGTADTAEGIQVDEHGFEYMAADEDGDTALNNEDENECPAEL